MTEQEKLDLEAMKKAVVDRKLRCFDYLRSVSRYNETDMKHSGYSRYTIAEAMKKVFEDAVTDIDKLHKAHVRKYPD